MNDKSLRCVSWVAVSSKPQYEKESPHEQRRQNLKTIEDLGGVCIAELEVPGQSRSIITFDEATERIEAYAQLRNILDNRGADLLVFRDQSRLGRTAAVEMCYEAGCALYNRSSPPSTLDAFEQANSDTTLIMNTLDGAFSQMEVRRLVRRNRTGMIGRVKRGDMPKKPPYGYVWRYAADGSRRVEVDPEAAERVRLMIELFLDGMSFEQIVEALVEIGAEPPGLKNGQADSGRWYKSTISRMLQRVYVYAGFVEFRPSGHEPIRERGTHEAIIDLSTAKAVEREYSSRSHRKTPSSEILFNRVLYCDRCSAWLTANHKNTSNAFRYYRCVRCRHQGKLVSINGKTVWRALDQFINEQVGTLADINRYVKATADPQLDSRQAKIDSLELALIEVEKERNRLLYMAQKGIMEPDEVGEKVEPLNKRRRHLRDQIDSIQAAMGANESETERVERIRRLVLDWPLLLDVNPTHVVNRILRESFQVYVNPDRRITKIHFI